MLTPRMTRKPSKVGRKLMSSPRDGVRMSVPPPLLFQLTAAAQFLPSSTQQTTSAAPKQSQFTHILAAIFDENVKSLKDYNTNKDIAY